MTSARRSSAAIQRKTRPDPEGPGGAAATECLDGNEAAARVAYALSEVIAIYPITPASPMGEHCDDWSAAGRPNLWGKVPDVVEMQSEAGAAGALHGALQKGALATTFTASQGLLLMIPNMFKIAGELTPAVIHVAARTVATHALSIFGDHSDVMHARTTGWAMLAAGSVQEAHDFALVAHAATLRAAGPVPALLRRLPHLARDRQDRASSARTTSGRWSARTTSSRSARRGLTPGRARSCAARPRTPTSSSRPARPSQPVPPRRARHRRRRSWTSSPRAPAGATGWSTTTARPTPSGSIVLMGSAAGAVEETVDTLVAAGEQVGLLRRPAVPAVPRRRRSLAALPPTVRSIAVLDRTKEPGAVGEPLYLDVVAALAEAMDRDEPPFAALPRVIGGRYGLSSKEFTPAMVKPVFDELVGRRGRSATSRSASTTTSRT